MKTIGRTNEGDYLVSMNKDEHRAIADLANVEADWTSIEAYYADPTITFIDLSTPIGAIRHYTKSRRRVQELQRLLNDIDDKYTDENDNMDKRLYNDGI